LFSFLPPPRGKCGVNSLFRFAFLSTAVRAVGLEPVHIEVANSFAEPSFVSFEQVCADKPIG